MSPLLVPQALSAVWPLPARARVSWTAANYCLDTDEDLLGRFLRGEPGGLDALVQRHHQPLLNLCWRMVGDREAAEDLVQETFWRLLTKADRFRKQASVRTWLYAIAINACRDHIRSRSRRRRHIATLEQEGLDGGSDEHGQWAAAQTARVSAALAGVDADTRAVLVLHFYRGLSYREIGQVMRWSASRVAQRIRRGLARLHMVLKEA